MVANIPAALWAEIPQHLRPGLARWLSHGIEPGSFLNAVIDGDLPLAVLTADDVSLGAVGYIGKFLEIFAPKESMGPFTRPSWPHMAENMRQRLLAEKFENYPEFIETLKQESAR